MKKKERKKLERMAAEVMTQPSDSIHPYSPSERQIFIYFTGRAWRWADPIAIRRRMALALAPHGLSIEKALLQCKDKDEPVKLQAKEFLYGAARIAFEMPYNPDAKEAKDYGASENQVIDALNAFVEFNKKKVASGVKSPTFPPRMDSTLSEPADSPSPSSTPPG